MTRAQYQLEGLALPPTVENREQCIFLFNLAPQFASLNND